MHPAELWDLCQLDAHDARINAACLYLQVHFRDAEGTQAAEDLPIASSSASVESQTAGDPASKEKGAHGCTHYRRRCRLVAPCCGETFWCRHCHNEVKSQDEMVCIAMIMTASKQDADSLLLAC